METKALTSIAIIGAGPANISLRASLTNNVSFGYKALRVYRRIVLRELRAVAADRGISVFYGRKFSKVVDEGEEGVTFEFEDGTRDGNMCITSAVKRSQLRLPTPYFPLPSSISSTLGVVVLAPQDPAGEEILVLTQRQHPEQDKEKWDIVRNNKHKLHSILQTGKETWPDVVQSALEHLDIQKLSVWPFYLVPGLTTWKSEKGGVIIIGDAAHAIPPPAGQGASQALEDAFSFSYLVSKLSKLDDRNEALMKWEKYRMARMERVTELTRKLSNRRLPAEALVKLLLEDVFVDGAKEGQSWLYEPRIEKTVDDLLSKLTKISDPAIESNLDLLSMLTTSKTPEPAVESKLAASLTAAALIFRMHTHSLLQPNMIHDLRLLYPTISLDPVTE
ncbi:putative oxidoreductase yetM [Glarea lozoyensis 74030]|uniref:Putative oxidoreductase yetM n=1 Tax=Glarea lozoyensis (strain ATCC 74030 / MF5533) TaxID=1104152 RepID=H0EUW8_GLAL7|nr:putative oxidoreductase yetM [Glarea lozoyensis 74030]